jgi:ribonuclease HI
MASRKLKHYFQSHTITVPSAFPLRDIFENKESSGRIRKWATELSQYPVEFTSRSAIKSQVLADFIVDWTPAEEVDLEVEPKEKPWEMACDGVYCNDGASAAAILKSPSGIKLRYAVRLDFEGHTNNVAEYEGLLLGLRKARALGARRLIIKTDSELIANHIGKSYKAINPEMSKYLKTVRSMEKYFFGFTVKRIKSEMNKEADDIAKRAAAKEPLPPDVFYEILKYKSICCDEAPVKFVNTIESEDWRSSIVAFLKGHYESRLEAEGKRMALRARTYVLVGEQLYKKRVLAPWLRCVSRAEGRELTAEIHAGYCGSHIGTRKLVSKAFRHAYYWPTAILDAEEVVRTCKNCQKHINYSKVSPYEIQLLPPVWPFARWGMDIVGPLPVAPGNYKYAVVAVEYFSKWIEAKPVQTITSRIIQKFFWKNIVCRFGVPYQLTVDNGKQFDCEEFRNFCFQLAVGNEAMLCFGVPPTI